MTKAVELYNGIHVNPEKEAPGLTRRNMFSAGELVGFVGSDGLWPPPVSMPRTPEVGK